MAIQGPIYRFMPAGLSDAVSEDYGFPGACQVLTNLIPDPGNRNLWQARPAAVQIASLGSASGFSSSSFISALAVVGNRVYGMAASTTYSGYDAPFCYDLISNSFVSISGVTGSNLPTSASSVYAAWTPPVMALVGTYLVITHPGYDGSSHFFGWINLSNPSSLTYSAGNTGTNALASKPVAVAQFFQRAYFMLNPTTGQPSIQATDVLNPLNIANAAYTLTFGDNIPLSGFGSVSLQSPLTGGVTAALLVFKADSNVFQITGDFALSNTSVNTLNAATGTASYNAIANTPNGVFFMAPDGIRVVNQVGNISPPVGAQGQGIVYPFINAGIPSRAAAASTAGVYRISVQNTGVSGSPVQEFWYDLIQQRWSGPHTFPASLICPWTNTFIMTPYGVNGSIWRSDVQQSSSSSYVENGNKLTCTLQTALFADAQQLARINLNEGFIKIAAYAGMPAPSAYLLNQNGTVLNTATLVAGGTATIWGAFVWGSALWGGAPTGIVQNPLQWSSPQVVNEAALKVVLQAGAGLKVGDIIARAEILGFVPGTP